MTRPSTRAALLVMAVMVIGLVPTVSTQNAPATLPAHVQLTRDEDFQRTRELLGLKTPALTGVQSSDPETFNDKAANPYRDLPDPLKLNDGRKVTSAAMWNSQRRAELLEIFEREIYGRTPKVTPRVTWEVLS